MSSTLKFEKVNTKPTVIAPNTLYFVKNGAGFDQYLSDSTGSNLIPMNVTDDIDPFLLMGVTNG